MPSPKTTRFCRGCGVPFIGTRAAFCSGRCRMARVPVSDRFWAKVDKSGACWVWTGSKGPTGYGAFGIGPKNYRAHRVSFELAFGAIPDGLDVCHRCDNPPCVNPAHLFVGTVRDNMADRDEKGRCQKGERHVRAKLNAESCLAIYESADPAKKIAKRFGISLRTVGRIRKAETWRHVLRAA